MATYSIPFKKMDKDVDPGGLKYIKVPEMSFKVDVTIDDKIFKNIQSDGILLEDMQAEVQKVYKQTCNSIKGKYSAFDKLFLGWINSGVDENDIKKHLDGLNKSIGNDIDVGEKAAEMAVDACWKKYLKTKKEYLKYKIKIVANITGAAASLATSITLTATAAFTGGASFAIGIIGMVKSVVTMTREIRSACADIQTAQKRLEDDLGKIKKADGKIAVRANEYSAAVLKQFLDVSQPSIKSCKSQMEIVEKKLMGVEVNVHEASKILNRMLDDTGKLKKAFMSEVEKKFEKMLGQRPKGQIDSIGKALDKQLAGGEKEIEEQVAHVQAMHAAFKVSEENTKQLKTRVEAFEDLRTLDVKVFENLLKFVDLPLAILDGNVVARASEIEVGLLVAGASFAYEKITAKALEGTILA